MAPGRYTAPGNPGTFHVVATSVADSSKSAIATVTVNAAPNITVSIAPGSASTQAGGTVSFTASVTGLGAGQSSAVSWSVQEGSAGGTINGAGTYTAPSSAGTFHVIATSVADNTESASATVAPSPPRIAAAHFRAASRRPDDGVEPRGGRRHPDPDDGLPNRRTPPPTGTAPPMRPSESRPPSMPAPPDRSSSCQRAPSPSAPPEATSWSTRASPSGAPDLDRPPCRRRTERPRAPTFPVLTRPPSSSSAPPAGTTAAGHPPI